jgi:hypothetical protein
VYLGKQFYFVFTKNTTSGVMGSRGIQLSGPRGTKDVEQDAMPHELQKLVQALSLIQICAGDAAAAQAATSAKEEEEVEGEEKKEMMRPAPTAAHKAKAVSAASDLMWVSPPQRGGVDAVGARARDDAGAAEEGCFAFFSPHNMHTRTLVSTREVSFLLRGEAPMRIQPSVSSAKTPPVSSAKTPPPPLTLCVESTVGENTHHATHHIPKARGGGRGRARSVNEAVDAHLGHALSWEVRGRGGIGGAFFCAQNRHTRMLASTSAADMLFLRKGNNVQTARSSTCDIIAGKFKVKTQEEAPRVRQARALESSSVPPGKDTNEEQVKDSQEQVNLELREQALGSFKQSAAAWDRRGEESSPLLDCTGPRSCPMWWQRRSPERLVGGINSQGQMVSDALIVTALHTRSSMVAATRHGRAGALHTHRAPHKREARDSSGFPSHRAQRAETNDSSKCHSKGSNLVSIQSTKTFDSAFSIERPPVTPPVTPPDTKDDENLFSSPNSNSRAAPQLSPDTAICDKPDSGTQIFVHRNNGVPVRKQWWVGGGRERKRESLFGTILHK